MKKNNFILAALVIGAMTACTAADEPLVDDVVTTTTRSDVGDRLVVIPDNLGKLKSRPDTTIVSVNHDVVTIDNMQFEAKIPDATGAEPVIQTTITVNQTLSAENQEYANDYMTLRLEGRNLLVITYREEQRPFGFSFIINLSANGSSATLKGFKKPFLYGPGEEVPDNLVVPSSMTFPASGGTLTATVGQQWFGFCEILVGDNKYTPGDNYGEMADLFDGLRNNGTHKFDWLTIQVKDDYELIITLDKNPGEESREFEICMWYCDLYWHLYGSQDGQTSSLPEIRL